MEKNKFPLSTRNRQLLFLNFEIAADDFWLNSQGLTTNLQSLEKIISNQAAYQKLSPNVVAIFEATRRQIVQNSLPFQLSEQGKKILKLHVEALSTKYPSIEDASEEVVRLYKKLIIDNSLKLKSSLFLGGTSADLLSFGTLIFRFRYIGQRFSAFF